MVLTTQNPVDLDYKAMSNAGTWLIGRLQTERDKERVLEGLRSAAGGTDVEELDVAVGRLQKRQFLLVSAKGSAPALFTTRWAMSYLRGPLTKDQVGALTRDLPPAQAEAAPGPVAPAPSPVETAPDASAVAPAVAEGVPVRFLDPAAPWASEIGAVADGRLHAFLAARVNLRFDDANAELDAIEVWEALYGPPLDQGLDLESETPVDYDDRDFRSEAPSNGGYVLPQAPLGEARLFRDATSQIQRRLVDNSTLEIQRNPSLKLFSRPGETPEKFAQLRCSRPGRGGPRDCEDPRPTGGEEGPPRGRARDRPTQA